MTSGRTPIRTEYLSLDLISEVKKLSMNNFGNFYNYAIKPCKAFTKSDFTKALNKNPISPKKHRQIIFALIKAQKTINAHYSDQTRHIPPIIDVEDPLYARMAMDYTEDYLSIVIEPPA